MGGGGAARAAMRFSCVWGGATEVLTAIQNVADAECDGFTQAEGPSVLFFDASWSAPARALEAVLTSVSQSVRIGRVDIDLHPSAIERFDLVACPTCDVFVDGHRRARLVGLASRARLLECLQGAGLPNLGVASSPLLAALEQKADRIDSLDEEAARHELCRLLSQAPAALLQLVGPAASVLAQGLAPVLFSLIREVSLLTRFMARELRSPATPSVKRVGLATALTFVAVETHRGLPGYLDDWLVLQAARLEFLEGEHHAPLPLLERLATVIGLATQVPGRRDMHSVLRLLAWGAEALDALPAVDDGFILLDELLRQPLPKEWTPPVLPTFQRLRREHAAFRLATRWSEQVKQVSFTAPGRIAVRCEDGATLEVVGTTTRVV